MSNIKKKCQYSSEYLKLGFLILHKNGQVLTFLFYYHENTKLNILQRKNTHEKSNMCIEVPRFKDLGSNFFPLEC